MPDKQVWKQRFILFTAARIFGILTLIAGLAISFSDVLRPGGWPLVAKLLKGGEGIVLDVKARLDRGKKPEGISLWRL